MADMILQCHKRTSELGVIYCFEFSFDLVPAPVTQCIEVYEGELSDVNDVDEAKAKAIVKAVEQKAKLLASAPTETPVTGVEGDVTL